MNSNILLHSKEILSNYNIYNLLNDNELNIITNDLKISIKNKNEIIFNSKEKLNSNFYIVYNGLIGLYAISNKNELLVDQCFSGTTFGLRPHFAQNVYQLTAKALEDTILLEISFKTFYEVAISNTNVVNYLLRSFATNKRTPNDELNPGFLVSQNVLNSIHNNTFNYFQQIKYNPNFLVASPLSKATEAIDLMQNNKISSVIIEDNNMPIGIITDLNIRNNFDKLTKNNSLLAKEIMSFPVITASENISLPEAQLIFLENSISYICITKNGLNNSKSIGLISIHDVISSSVDNPNIIIQQIKYAKNKEEVKNVRLKINQFIDNITNLNIPIQHTSKIIGKFNDFIIEKVIQLTLSEEESQPPTPFAWFSLGSMARHEQILLTDQNSGLVFLYDNDQDRKYTEIRNYFTNFASKVVKVLHSIGYEYCKDGIMANNLFCCKSLKEWNFMYNDWIFETKNIKNDIDPIFFDIHFIHGDINLFNQIVLNTISIDNKKEDVFLSYLGKNSLKYPSPLGFFNQFIKEDNEEEKDEFNIKLRAIQPLVDAARVLIFAKNEFTIRNTIKRFSKLIELDPKNKLVYEDCIESFAIFQEFRTLEGIKDQNNGNFVAVDKLSKQDQNKLKQSFESLQNIQEIIKNKFNFNYFN